eukprot:CAMPEP_0202472166 /NCGR_PEP_ID=MMETSP1360-20130828/86884_1 /ASSEMBLY_ACC=CAM_ASM_000848 /TAXON_ID=515479 /ORGANISM="Licmophora paradoxa, Strain CCMP2313" /LENGTH=75 /DNA_ID=CAMNT_0049098523 /DNA_START=57 /DNA_END=280 /DNA_ORIENTATION=-
MTIINAAAQVTQDQFKLLGIRTLGVDYGLARTGVAVSVGYNPEPIDIIEETNATVLAHRVVQLALSQQVQRVILG